MRSWRIVVVCLALGACGSPARPAGAGSDSGVASASPSGQSPAPTTLAPAGGKLALLRFAVVGDTRPYTQDDNANYPVQTITTIYRDIAALSPQPAFVITTGDYQYATPGSGNSKVQVGDYVSAMTLFPGPVFAAMGNHECNGWTSSNCADNPPTTNLAEFESQILGRIGQTNPYYAIPIQAADGSWTAKIVVIAANDWDQAQATWLSQAMAQPTDYTFVVRHEPSSYTTAPGVSPSDAILAKQPYTLLLTGHKHSYIHPATDSYEASNCQCDFRELIVGNGGVPPKSGDIGAMDYGFALIDRQSDGTLSVQQYNYQSNAPEGDAFRITPDGKQAQ